MKKLSNEKMKEEIQKGTYTITAFTEGYDEEGNVIKSYMLTKYHKKGGWSEVSITDKRAQEWIDLGCEVLELL